MKFQNTNISGILILLFISLLFSCSPDKKSDSEESKQEEKQVIEIVTNALDIQMPDQVPSGWNTFRYTNKSSMTHLIVFEKMPIFEGRQLTVEDSKKEMIPAFQLIMNALIAGDPPPYDSLPKWHVAFKGGVGLIGPGHSTEITLKMEPGTYVAECYVKNPGGQFHSAVGMVAGFEVTDTPSGLQPPQPNFTINVSSDQGIEAPRTLEAGNHIVAIHFRNQKQMENFLQMDVNLIRIEEHTDLDTVSYWINWMNPTGLQVPAPAEFLGGIQETDSAGTGYFHVVLKPGKYAWISEVPNPASKNLLKEFMVE